MIKEHLLKRLLKGFYADWLSTNDIYSPTHYGEIYTYVCAESEIDESERNLYADEIKKHFNAFKELTTDWPSHKKQERVKEHNEFQPLVDGLTVNFPKLGRKIEFRDPNLGSRCATLVKFVGYGKEKTLAFAVGNGRNIESFPYTLLWRYVD